jgi:hypothetical protein
MSSDTDKPFGQEAGLPFTGLVARQITEELFREQAQWRSSDLVDRVVELHRARGGSIASDPSHILKRVLQRLRDDGSVTAPGHGCWRWTNSPPQGHPVPEEPVAIAPSPVAVDDFGPAIRPDKELGIGRECVYLYFNPNDRRLAELEGRDVWECKIGRTSDSDASNRILGQGVRTALSRLPTIGLVLRTDDSFALENALHSSLRLVNAEVPDSPGDEWFITSPARVEAWYVSFQSALAAIGTSSTIPRQQPVAPRPGN